MAEPLCLDAGVLFKVLVPEPGSPQVRELAGEAMRGEGSLLGPALLPVEVLSVLRQHSHRGALSPEQAETAVDALLGLPIEEVGGREVYRRAWEIAGELGLPVVYDAVYLAVAETRGAAFWTADRKLYERAADRGYVHLLGEGG